MGRVRRRRSLERQLKVLKQAVADKEAQLAPTLAEQRAESDKIRESLMAKLAATAAAPEPTGVMELTNPLAIELLEKSQKLADDTKERQRAERAEFLKRTAGRWTRLLRGEPEKVEQDEKVISIASAKSGCGWAGMSAAEDDYPDPDSYFNLRGSSESEIWKEAYKRYGPSE